MDFEVYNISGKKSSKKFKGDDAVFAVEPNDHAIYLDVKQHMANKRQGTHQSRQRGEIIGSTRKIKRQKGTGTARAGSIKNPLFRGGGRVFGPEPRDYSFKLNKKVKRLARLSALSYKAQEKAIIGLEKFELDKPATKTIASALKALKLEGQRTLFVVPEKNDNINLSVRNLPKGKVITADQLNTYDVMNANRILVLEGAIEKVEEQFKA